MIHDRIGRTALCAMLLLGSALTAHAAGGRERLLLDAGWRFHRGDFQETSGGAAIARWQWKPAETGNRRFPAWSDDLLTGDAGWQEAAPGQDTFHGRRGFSWYRATLGDAPGPHRQLSFDSVDDNAMVYLNGKRLARHAGWDDPFEVPLDSAWRAGGPNVVVVLVQNTDGAGGIGAARLETVSDATPAPARAGYDDHAWRVVHLPHDFVVEGTFTPNADGSHGFLPKGVAWYRKVFTLPASARGRRVWIDFDGVYRDARVYLNGKLLGEHPSGYTSFRYDISRAAHFGGTNVLAVRVDARASEGWWYEGGGIYRHVWLNVAAPLHVAPWGTFVASTVSGTNASRPARAVLSLTTTLTNSAAAPASCTLVSEIQAPGGIVVARASRPATVPATATVDLPQRITVAHPQLWSLETPLLYRLVTRVVQDGQTVDRVTTPFGIRTLRFDAARGFFLNGKPVKIQGTCNHQDFAGVGIGMPDSLLYWRIQKLKAMGANAYRCSHNPPAAELLDACDKLGMLVMDENRHLGDTDNPKTAPGTPYTDLSELASMIERDRNHPSVILWSMCNEEPLQGSDEGKQIFAAMMNVVHRYDRTRPITCAMNGDWGRGIGTIEDIQGGNYNPDGYDDFHQTHPAMPFFGSETGSTVSTRGEYANDPAKGYVSAYDVNAPPWAQTAEDAWRPIAERPFVAGGFVWTGFDYKGEPTPYGWPCINSHFGIMDICGFPKDNYYYYQAWWGDKPLVHILPHWNWAGKEGQPIDVWCYSNAGQVELLLNGRSLGRKEMPRYGHVSWSVPYAPGRLEARAYTGGRQVASDAVETAGAPARLRLTPDRAVCVADGEDVIPVTVDVLDAQGRIVPTAGNTVSFQVTGAGRVAGVGNGDPSDHTPDKASERGAFHGRCLVLVGAGERPGDIQLMATSPALKPARLRLRAAPSGQAAGL